MNNEKQKTNRRETFLTCKIKDGKILLGSQELRGVKKYKITASSEGDTPNVAELAIKMVVSTAEISSYFGNKQEQNL